MEKTILKYIVAQVPGWILIALLLVMLRLWFGVSLWVLSVVMVAWLVKDAILFRYVKPAYETGNSETDGDITGGEGRARERLDPSGYIVIRGRLWRARVKKGAGPIEEGGRVRIEGRSGLTLIVVPADERAERK
jgi:membrane protein implicated in regulation of membrane protease activity